MDEKPSTTQAPQGHPQSVPPQNVSAPPNAIPAPHVSDSPELDFKRKVILLFGALITVNEQLLAQLGHATDQHPLLKDAKEQLADLNAHTATVAAANPSAAG